MGAPGYTVFCENGHIVKSVIHHCIDDREIDFCKFCSSDKFHTEVEWGDPDYGESVIPSEPIDFIPVKMINGKTGKVYHESKVFVYDVSKIKKWKTSHL